MRERERCLSIYGNTIYCIIQNIHNKISTSQVVLVVKNPTANARDITDSGSIPGSGRSPGELRGNPLQYSCLENSMDIGG